MGVDLIVCPDDYHGVEIDLWFLAYARLHTNRDYHFYDAIRALGPAPLPSTVRFQWYGDDGLETHTADPYGAPLTSLDAGRFAMLPPTLELSRWNRGVVAFLTTIAPQTRVVLWWH